MAMTTQDYEERINKANGRMPNICRRIDIANGGYEWLKVYIPHIPVC